MLSFLERNLNPRRWGVWRQPQEADAEEVLQPTKSFLKEDDVAGSSSQKERMHEISQTGGETQPGTQLRQHPMDPHKPNFSELLPEAWRPYPSFEGWFIRIWDPEKGFSAAAIVATNYASAESEVTILFALGKKVHEGSSDRAVKWGHTYAVAVKTKVIFFRTLFKLKKF